MARAIYFRMKSKISTSSYNIVLPFSDSLKSINKILKTTVTNDVNEAMAWIEGAGEGATLGLEVQCYNIFDNDLKPAILTLCDGYRCLILQICHRRNDEGKNIKDLLLPVKRFVGANLGRTAGMLKEAYGIIVPGYEKADKNTNSSYVTLSDTSLWVDEFLVEMPVRASKLMMVLMMMRKMRRVEDAVWEKEELDLDQVIYATLEAYVYYMLLNE